MLENEQSTNTTENPDTEGSGPAKKTARRRTTKKTTASTTAATGDGATAAPATAATEAKKAPARKRTAKKAVTGPPQQAEAPVAEAPAVKKSSRRPAKKATTATDSPFAGASAPPEPASRPSRRTAAPALLFQAPEQLAAPRAAPPTTWSSTQAAVEPAATEPTSSRRTRTRSSSRSAGAPDQVTDSTLNDSSAGAPVADAPEPEAAADTTSRRTRTRSASRAAGAPTTTGARTADADASSESRDTARTGDDESSSGASGASADGDGDGDQPSSSSRRRRRGSRGRGRKPSSAGEDDVEGEPAESAETISAADTATEDAAAAADPAESATSSRSGRSRSRSRSSSAKAAAEAASADGEDEPADQADDGDEQSTGDGSGSTSSSRRRRRRRRSSDTAPTASPDDPPQTIVKVRDARPSGDDAVTGVSGSTRLEAKKQRRRDGRDQARRRTPVLTEAEFLARRESVDRVMVVRQSATRTQIAVLEDGVLVEHYVTQSSQTSYVGNVYLGRVQNVLPAMEAAFIDIGKGRNGVLYAGEVAWSRLGLEGKPKRVESVLSSGSPVLVQVTKDPVAHKGARLTGMITLPGRFLVYAPGGSMSGISRKLPENERNRLKTILKKVFPDEASVIIRTAAEGASEEELTRDVNQLESQWNEIETKLATATAPSQLYAEPDLAIKVVRDMFNEDVAGLVISGDEAWDMLHGYVSGVAPDLVDRVTRWESDQDVFAAYRVDEQIAKALDRKVWLPSGGSLVIDRTEAMTVIDVNTGKFTGSGGSLEETVTKNNLEAAEEIVRQIRLRDVGGIIVIDFIDMVLEQNRDLVLRRLVECLGRDRTRHQVAEVTSLGLVQMTRKRVGVGLFEAFSEPCEHCQGRGVHVHSEPIEQKVRRDDDGSNGRRDEPSPKKSKSSSGSTKGGKKGKSDGVPAPVPDLANGRKATEVIKAIAAAASRAHSTNGDRPADADASAPTEPGDASHAEPEDVDVLDPIDVEYAAIASEAASVEDQPVDDTVEPEHDQVPASTTTGRPKRGRVTRPAGAPA